VRVARAKGGELILAIILAIIWLFWLFWQLARVGN
jgi:VIT1/CCC1 family predicted Fe2+/Mn2+ transporter